MNILHIRSQYIADGGVETFINAFITHVDKNTFKNYIALLANSKIKRRFFYEALPYGDNGDYRSIECKKVQLYLPSVKEILRIIREKNIDVIHSHDIRSNLLAFIIKKVMRYSVVWVASGHGWVKTPLKTKIGSDIDKIIIRFAERIHFASESLFDQLRSLPRDKLVAIPYLLDDSNVKEHYDVTGMRKRWNIPEKCMILGMVGRLSIEKGHEYLLRAMSKVIREFPDTRLIIVGEGPMEAKLKDVARQLGLDHHVIFTGFYEDSLEACSLFDVFVHSSLGESLSMVILEAIRLGKPVVATTVGANRDLVIEDKNGYLVGPGDENALAEGIGRILRGKDKKKLKEFSAASLDIAHRKYSTSVVIKQYEGFYRNLMQDRTGARK